MFLVVPFLGVVASTWRLVLHLFDPDDAPVVACVLVGGRRRAAPSNVAPRRSSQLRAALTSLRRARFVRDLPLRHGLGHQPPGERLALLRQRLARGSSAIKTRLLLLDRLQPAGIGRDVLGGGVKVPSIDIHRSARALPGYANRVHEPSR